MAKKRAGWVHRHLTDQYVKAAQAGGYRSRAYYKLLEMEERFHLIQPGTHVLDLGGAPGSWSQLVLEASKATCTVLAVDRLPIAPLAGVTVLQADCTEPRVYEDIVARCQHKTHLVLSDMAPDTTGISSCDHARIMELCRFAHRLAQQVLQPGGNFVTKIFQGGEEKSFALELNKNFERVSFVKPRASRSNSREMYLVALRFKKV